MIDLAAFAAALPEAGPRIQPDEPMARHSTFQVGGPADIFFEPRTPEEVRTALAFAQERSLPVTILGAGSNIVVADRGIRGLVISFGSHFASHEVSGSRIRAQSGLLLAKLATIAMQAGLGGFEFASGIPGSVGGAVMMNAGAYDHCLDEVILDVTCLTPELEILCLEKAALNLGYRHSIFTDGDTLAGSIILGMTIELKPRPVEAIRAEIIELGRRRTASQPLEWPSAGSAFKRPIGNFAGRLIADCGLKGTCIGGAAVSEKHAGFVINSGGATASDIRRLFRHIQQIVLAQTGVRLMPEVRFIGDWDPAEMADLPECDLPGCGHPGCGLAGCGLADGPVRPLSAQQEA